MFWPGWGSSSGGLRDFFFQGLPQLRRVFQKEKAHESWRVSVIEWGVWKSMCPEIEAGIKKKKELCFPSFPVIMKLNIRLLRSVSSTDIYLFYLKNIDECIHRGTLLGVVGDKYFWWTEMCETCQRIGLSQEI